MSESAMPDVKKRSKDVEIKHQHFEAVVFKEVHKEAPEKFRQACDDAAQIRCEVLEEQTGVSLDLIKNTRVDNGRMLDNKVILSGIEMKIGAARIVMEFAGP